MYTYGMLGCSLCCTPGPLDFDRAVHVERRDWQQDIPPDDRRREQHTLERYTGITETSQQGRAKALEGFVYAQIQVRCGPSDHDHAIEEIDCLLEAALETKAAPPLLGAIAWAPLPEGPDAIKAYLAKLFSLPNMVTFAASSLSLTRRLEPSTPGSTPSVIKGVRWMLEWHPRGCCLEGPFIEGLRVLGSKGLLFEFCVSTALHGIDVLDEVLDCIHRTREKQEVEEQTRFVLDHLCKPDLRGAVDSPLYLRGTEYAAFTAKIFEFALLEHVTIKLSGLLTECEPLLLRSAFREWAAQRVNGELSSYTAPLPGSGHLQTLKKALRMFLEPVLDSFGHERLMFGSDFPIYRACLFPGTSPEPSMEMDRLAFAFAPDIYAEVLVEFGLGGEELDAIFAGNARRVYQL